MREDHVSITLQRLQRQRWVRYIFVEALLGMFVGYYMLPRLFWFAGVVALLSWSVGMQLSILRQQRRTWQSHHLQQLIDAIERISGGLALVFLSLYGLLEVSHHELIVAVGVWTAFFFIAGTASGEYWWQMRRFRRLEHSAQLRYLCNCMRRRRIA